MEENPPTPAGRDTPRSRTPRAAFSTPEQPTPPSKPVERAPRRAAKAAPPVTFQPPSADSEAGSPGRPPSKTSSGTRGESPTAAPAEKDQRQQPKRPRKSPPPKAPAAPAESPQPAKATTPAKKAPPAKAPPGKATPPEKAPADKAPAEATPAEAASAKAVPAKATPAEAASAKAAPAKAAPAKAAKTAKATPAKKTARKAARPPAPTTPPAESPTAPAGKPTRPAESPTAPAGKPTPAGVEGRTVPAGKPTPADVEAAAVQPPAAEVAGRAPQRTEPWAKLVADPGHTPELLALAAVQTIGPRAQQWADRTREAYPGAGPDALARLAQRQFTRFGSVSSVFAAVAGTYAPVALMGSNALTYAELVLHIAAAYGLDPADERRATDLLVLTGVHPSHEDAQTAMQAARQPAYSDDATLSDAVWRLGRMVAAQAGVWVAVKAVNRLFPGTAMLAAVITSRSGARTMAGKATAYYRAYSQESQSSGASV